jgi:hypothetical protein
MLDPMKTITGRAPQVAEHEWMPFPGGELEGKRPRVLCRSCRAQLSRVVTGEQRREVASDNLSCFQCYRAELERDRALKVAGGIETASEERFQTTLPFEPVNRVRLDHLRAERMAVRLANQAGNGQYADKRRQAQIAARHTLQQIAAGLHCRRSSHGVSGSEMPANVAAREWNAAVHAAELQLPESWLPFVMSR